MNVAFPIYFIEKLRQEVAELHDKLAALTQKHDAHTHRLRLGITRFPHIIDCNETAARGGHAGGAVFGWIDKACKQIGDDYVSVMIGGSTPSMVTAPPGP